MKEIKMIESGIEYRVEEYECGSRHWYFGKLLHREVGPAVEFTGYNRGGIELMAAVSWYRYGQLHKETGPAITYINGDTSYYLYGKFINCQTQEEFEQYLKLKAFW